MIEIKIGDWAVWRDRWKITAGDVRKVTAQRFVSRGRYSSRDQQYDRASVVFAGPQEIAERLKDQLLSSEAQFNEDKQRAGERKYHRDNNFIAKAAEASAPKAA